MTTQLRLRRTDPRGGSAPTTRTHDKTPTRTTVPAVALTGLVKTYGSVRAVGELSLTLAAGEMTALLGPNGAGKSTTIDLLLGLSRPDSGQTQLFGLPPAAACAQGLVGAVLQAGGLPPGLAVRQLLELLRGLYPKGMAPAEALALAGVTDLADRHTDRLSGGQRQRVRFACALLPDPALLVLDEPTAAMDVESRAAFWTAMRAWSEQGRTVLFSTHYLEEADDVDRVVLLRAGRVAADGTAAQVRAMVGGRTLTCTLPVGGGGREQLAALPGVTAAELSGANVTLRCSDSDRTLPALLAGFPGAHDIEVGAVGLEQAYLAVTGAGSGAPFGGAA